MHNKDNLDHKVKFYSIYTHIYKQYRIEHIAALNKNNDTWLISLQEFFCFVIKNDINKICVYQVISIHVMFRTK